MDYDLNLAYAIGFTLYVLVGMIAFVMSAAWLKLNRDMGRELPHLQVRCVTVAMFLWPFMYWVRRHYQYLVNKAMRERETRQLRQLQERATRSAVQAN